MKPRIRLSKSGKKTKVTMILRECQAQLMSKRHFRKLKELAKRYLDEANKRRGDKPG